MALDILELRKLCIPKNIRITLHAAKRLEQRRIFLKDVIACIMNGEIIEQYPQENSGTVFLKIMDASFIRTLR